MALWKRRKALWVCATRRFSSFRSSPMTAKPWALRGRSCGSPAAPGGAGDYVRICVALIEATFGGDDEGLS